MNTELYCHYLFQVMKFKCYDDPKLLLRGSRNIPPCRYLDLFLLAPSSISSISAALSCPLRGRSAGSFPEQRLVIEPTSSTPQPHWVNSNPVSLPQVLFQIFIYLFIYSALNCTTVLNTYDTYLFFVYFERHMETYCKFYPIKLTW